MPVPTVFCSLCKKQVTKRSTVSLEALGASGGRACREHEFVATLVEKHRADVQTIRDLDRAARMLKIMMGAATIRIMHSIHGIEPELIYARMQHVEHQPAFITEVREEVNRLGGPRMSEAEMFDTVAGAVQLMARGLA